MHHSINQGLHFCIKLPNTDFKLLCMQFNPIILLLLLNSSLSWLYGDEQNRVCYGMNRANDIVGKIANKHVNRPLNYKC